jgi:hypothetical protein
MIIPTNKISPAAVFSDTVGIVRETELNRLRKRLRAFVNEFAAYDFKSLNDQLVNTWLDQHKLSIDDIKLGYQKESYLGGPR